MLITVLGVPLNGWAALSLTLQFILPLLVGLVTTKETNRERQFVLLSGLTLVATVLAEVLQAHQQGLAINYVQIIVSAVVNLAISLLSHYGVWKPTNISALMLALFSHQPIPPVPPADAAGDSSLPVRKLHLAPPVPEEEYRARHSL